MPRSKKKWDGETGWIDKEMLSRPFKQLAGTDLLQMLVRSSIDEDDIRTEKFAGYRSPTTLRNVGRLEMGNYTLSRLVTMLANKPKTKILVDGGDPQETLHVKETIGFVDGQTTNPSLIAKNPEIQQRIASGHSLSAQEEKDEYRKIVQAIPPLVGDAGVPIEVFADIGTTEMFSWIPNAYIKYPCTKCLMTLCFSQDQAAADYAATKGSKEPVYVSPFVGRLDDHGENGMDVVKNIKKMFNSPPKRARAHRRS